MNAVVVISLTVGVLLAGFSHLLVWMGRDIMNRGKKRIVWVDDDARELGVALVRTGGKNGPVKLQENEFTVGKGEQAQLYRLDARAAYGGKYPSYIVHKRHGFTLHGPADSETVHKDPGLALALAIADPLASFKARTRNHASDTMNSNEERKEVPWVALALIGGVFLLAIVVMLGYVISKLSKAGAA